MPFAAKIRVLDAIKALAFVGDLSMGQPIDHSVRTAWLAGRISAACGHDPAACAAAQQVALLRWSGCTANAPEIAEMLGDDVRGRAAMLASREPHVLPPGGLEQFAGHMLSVAQIHCEVSGDIASMLQLGSDAEEALRCIFEAFDGRGIPGRRQGAAVPAAVLTVCLASDLEIFSRLYGLEQALVLIARKADKQYPSELVDCVAAEASQWLKTMAVAIDLEGDFAAGTAAVQRESRLELIADVIDLKLPWMTGYSRQVARLALECCAQLGLDAATQQLAYRAGLIHGIGRAAVPNAIWNLPEPLPGSALERMRLVPYWTARAARQIAALEAEAEIASFAFERTDGSGYFRGSSGAAIPLAGQVLALAVEWSALRLRKPGRDACSSEEASEHLLREAARGGFDAHVVQALLAAVTGQRTMAPFRPASASLSERETDVLRHISQGQSTKEVARVLGISASTVRTHVESVFRKLGCSTRAAATLKASTSGLL